MVSLVLQAVWHKKARNSQCSVLYLSRYVLKSFPVTLNHSVVVFKLANLVLPFATTATLTVFTTTCRSYPSCHIPLSTSDTALRKKCWNHNFLQGSFNCTLPVGQKYGKSFLCKFISNVLYFCEVLHITYGDCDKLLNKSIRLLFTLYFYGCINVIYCMYSHSIFGWSRKYFYHHVRKSYVTSKSHIHALLHVFLKYSFCFLFQMNRLKSTY